MTTSTDASSSSIRSRSVLLLATSAISAPRLPQVPGGLLAHLAGAEQKDGATVEAAEHLLGERGRGRRHRGRALPDCGLGPNLATAVERLPEGAVEQRPGRPELVRDAHLAEDLALAGHERVEACGDAEEMVGRGAVVQSVKGRLDLRPERGERGDRIALGLLCVVSGEVELGPVAGREADGLPPVRREPGRKRLRVAVVQRDLLAQLDRRVMVGRTDEDETHHAKWVTGRARRTMTTRAKPARAR